MRSARGSSDEGLESSRIFCLEKTELYFKIRCALPAQQPLQKQHDPLRFILTSACAAKAIASGGGAGEGGIIFAFEHPIPPFHFLFAKDR